MIPLLSANAPPAGGLLRLPRTVLFGQGNRRTIGAHAASFGHRALICTDERVARSTALEEITASLAKHGIDTLVFAETTPELPTGDPLACVARFDTAEIDMVIGLGGGSCLDMAKVVALLLTHGGHPRDYYGEMRVPGPILPVLAVPTTAGTGSEATPVAVLADTERRIKIGISSPFLVPELAMCDPELTHSCPPSLTAAAGADAVSHLVESFTAVRRPEGAVAAATDRVFVGKGALTDSFALEGIRLAYRSLRVAYDNPSDTAARADVMLAAFAGGVALGCAGTAAAHALQYPIGALTKTAHGLGVGCLMPYVMRFNLPARTAEFARIGTAIGLEAATREQLAAAAVLALDELLAGVGIPPTLVDLGISEGDLDHIVDAALTLSRLVENNPRRLDRASLRRVAAAALVGDRDFDRLAG